jgi:hypothetical protein
LFDSVEPSKIPELDDRPALLHALGEVYGEAVDRKWVNLERLADECVDADTVPSDAYRYYLNIVTPTEEAAFDIDLWKSLEQDFKPPPGELVTLGFDGARFHDTTALVGTHVDSGFQWVVGLWERPPNVAEWEVPEADVDEALAAAQETWDVWRVYADPP